MFTLIESPGEALYESKRFLAKRNFSIPHPVQEYLPFAERLPCLLSFFTGYQKQGPDGPIVSMLGCHHCNKELAKCLVYNKTNRLDSTVYPNWHYMHPIEDYVEFLWHKRMLHGTLYVAKAVKFDNTLNRCINNSEPFLYHIQSYNNEAGKITFHQEILDLDTAKSLIYYRKNQKLVEGISSDRLFAFIRHIEKSDAEWARNKNKAIDYVGKMFSVVKNKNKENVQF